VDEETLIMMVWEARGGGR